MPVLITKRFKFEAAHQLLTMPDGHKCRRIHGHNFRVEVNILGEIDPSNGMVMDFADIKTIVDPLIDMLDHQLINEVGTEKGIPLLQVPTTENLAMWFFQEIKPTIGDLYSIVIHETDNNSSEYRDSW